MTFRSCTCNTGRHVGFVLASQGDIVPQAASLVCWRAGRQHRRWFWARARSPALHVVVDSLKGRLRMPHSGVDPPDRRRWGAAGTSSQPQQAQKKEAPLMLLFLKNTRNPLGRSCPHTWSMTSEGRSLHLARPDPTQLDQHAARRAWHPAAPRRERMERARVAEDRSVQQAAEDHSSTAWPFTLACTTPRNKVTRSWPPSPHEGLSLDSAESAAVLRL